MNSHIQMSIYCGYRELIGEINGEWIGCICDFLIITEKIVYENNIIVIIDS